MAPGTEIVTMVFMISVHGDSDRVSVYKFYVFHEILTTEPSVKKF